MISKHRMCLIKKVLGSFQLDKGQMLTTKTEQKRLDVWGWHICNGNYITETQVMSWVHALKFMAADRKSFAVQLVARYLFLLTMLHNKQSEQTGWKRTVQCPAEMYSEFEITKRETKCCSFTQRDFSCENSPQHTHMHAHFIFNIFECNLGSEVS